MTSPAARCAARSARSAGHAVTPACRVGLWSATSIVDVLENDAHRFSLQRLQRLRLCGGDTGVPHRARVLQYRPNHRDVKVQQVITPAGALQLLKKVQSRCRLRRDGVDMLSPLQVTRNMHTQQLERGDAFHRRAIQTGGGGSLITEPISSSLVLRSPVERAHRRMTACC